MKRVIIFSFFVLIISSQSFAQGISNLFLRAQYSVTAIEYIGNKQYNDWMYLDLGKNESIYYSFFNHARDSIVQSQLSLGYSAYEIMENTRNIQRGRKDVFNISSESKTIKHYSVITAEHYFKSEPVEQINWTISKDTLTILSYKCIKATARFRGRDWTAWFTQDIPITAGPWKLRGLPGLILKACDADNHYTFECKAIGGINRNLDMKAFAKFREISAKEFDMLVFKFKTDALTMLENKGIKITGAKDANGNTIDLKQRKSQYNPIER